jgi:hypothetical protein
MENQNMYSRAWKETENFRKDSFLWFLGVEMLIGGISAATTATVLWNTEHLTRWQVWFIVFGFFVIGLLFAYVLIFLYHLIRAPYKTIHELQTRIGELLPLEQIAKSQRDNPAQFMSARFERLMFNKQNSWVACDVVIASKLQYSIAIKCMDIVFHLKTGWTSEVPYDMKTHKWQQCGVVSGEALQPDRKVSVYAENIEFSEKLLTFWGTNTNNTINAFGELIITPKDSKEIPLKIPEQPIRLELSDEPFGGDIL